MGEHEKQGDNVKCIFIDIAHRQNAKVDNYWIKQTTGFGMQSREFSSNAKTILIFKISKPNSLCCFLLPFALLP